MCGCTLVVCQVSWHWLRKPVQCISPLPFLPALGDLDTSAVASYLAFLAAVLRDRSPKMAQTAKGQDDDDDDEDEVVPVLSGALVSGV